MNHQLTEAQWKRVSKDYAKMYVALSRITKYASVAYLRRRAEKLYGVSPSEAIEMAYYNVLSEAKVGLRSVRKPFSAKAD
jgi:hypothetical protein